METTLKKLTLDDKQLLAEALISQQYALEIIISELNDIESGIKRMEQSKYLQLLTLYEKLRIR
ncbi:antirepressor AbbA [Metabacillus sp. 22489]|uniref:antirepressor AbbA n=1 Tax=Metabacillus sp. 22489 TaxID=3453928 RepID=UPI003F829A4C